MFDNTTFSLASAVANNGTVTVGYPEGRSQGDYDWTPGKHVLFVAGNQYNAPADFTLTFNANASDITLTNKSGVSWPAQSACRLQIDRPGAEDKRIDNTVENRDRVRQIPAQVALINLGSPDVADPNGYCESQDLTAAGVFSVDTNAAGAIAAAALVGKADVPRNVVASWTGTAVVTVTGLDVYGETVVESSGSGTSLAGKKAMVELTGISTSANITSLTVGTGDVLGLPVRVGEVGNVLAEYKDGVLTDLRPGIARIPFQIDQTDLLAATPISVPSPVAGVISKLVTIAWKAVTTGGAVTMKVNNTAVDGLSVTVADGGGAGDLDSDTPTLGHASTVVAVGDELEILPASNFDTAGALTGYIEITTVGTFVAADDAEATATTGDVRGTYDPLDACDGDDGYMLLVALTNPADKGVAQYGG
jgi:hypothetical protein